MRHSLISGYKALGLCSILCAGLLSSAMAKEKTKAPAMPPTSVSVATAQQQQWMEQIKATGTFSAFQGIVVKPQVAGPITKIFFQDGTYIEKGQPIVQVYPNIVEAQLQKNLAALQLAKLNYERGVTLFAKRVISQQDLDTLTSTLEQSQSTVQSTQADLEQYNLIAPFSGMLGLRRVDEGTYVTPGQAIVPLQQVDPLRVEFTVPEVFISQLALGQTVDVVPSSNPKVSDKGEVYAFDSAVNPDTRALSVRAKVPNKDHHLIPGTFAEITLNAGKERAVIAIPQTAVVYSPQLLYVYKVVNNKAIKTTITVGARKGDDIEVKTGLKIGDVVVTAGQIKLIDNAPVVVQPAPSAPPATATTPSTAKSSTATPAKS